MRKPGIATAVPVPRRTTSIIMSWIAAAVSCDTGRRQPCAACAFTIVLAAGRDDARDDVGLHLDAVVADRAATIAICSGVTSRRSWPNARRPGSTWLSRRGKKSLPLLVETAGATLVDRCLERGGE